MISRRKDEYQNYIACRSSDPKNSGKTYWSVIKTFYNGKKVTIIPPLPINNKLISDFEVKVNKVNDFFVSECTPFKNNIKIPETQSHVINSKLSSFKFEGKDISNIIRSLRH